MGFFSILINPQLLVSIGVASLSIPKGKRSIGFGIPYLDKVFCEWVTLFIFGYPVEYNVFPRPRVRVAQSH